MDILDIEILEDGTLSVKTSDISEKNHMSADEMLEVIEDLFGSKRVTTPIEHRFWKNRMVQRINGKTKIVQKG